MRNYESIYIIHPEVAGEELTAMVEKFQGILTEQGAEVYNLDNWGVRKLAYPINKVERGCYVQTLFSAEPQVIAEYERRMRLDEKVLRFLTVKLDGDFPAIEAAEAAEEAEVVEEVSAEEEE
ncbi:SSU ribosomal protein S6P [Malonomonas rubra DSM 5091]|uniref:Small ribosomal subunit protein bS6 n=1 Tax=Malonomonas rubra DSM 5091 TaxID=1122189 RepID=A0A1M6E379_MALRU|nr:30S ribosomal protein S6 [Malonomonas rubra]SHI79855.1 SSU ribosomal protein S6P [Malonomonas rubra DSM 5091]